MVLLTKNGKTHESPSDSDNSLEPFLEGQACSSIGRTLAENAQSRGQAPELHEQVWRCIPIMSGLRRWNQRHWNHPQLHSQFEANLESLRPCLKNKFKKHNNKNKVKTTLKAVSWKHKTCLR